MYSTNHVGVKRTSRVRVNELASERIRARTLALCARKCYEYEHLIEHVHVKRARVL